MEEKKLHLKTQKPGYDEAVQKKRITTKGRQHSSEVDTKHVYFLKYHLEETRHE